VSTSAIFETQRGGIFTIELDAPLGHIPPAYEIESKTYYLTPTPLSWCSGIRGFSEPVLYIEETFGNSDALHPDD
jgi:hypothetical protein